MHKAVFMVPVFETFSERPLGRTLSILGKSYLHLLRVRLKHLDIDRNYYALLLIGSMDGVITQQELALMLETDKVSIVRVVDYLTLKGYVKRIRKPDDMRKRSLKLTEKAILAIPEIRKSISELNDLVLNGVDITRIHELSETIRIIKSNMTENIQTL
ncbi:MAG: MarR family transcriptional regulator [Bacteroidales bacterium]|nr:MarR family transcriptional regulator [Bacteroidales bacterium]